MKPTDKTECDGIIGWLTGGDNPAVAYRTKKELSDIPAGDIEDDRATAREWLFGKLPDGWHQTKGIWYIYYLTAAAEAGLSADILDRECLLPAFDILEKPCSYSCSEFMLLRALVMLGCGGGDSCEPSVSRRIEEIDAGALPDGGFLCRERLDKLDYTPKSCYKANLFALMLAAECKKRGIKTGFTDGILYYFLRRDVFYKSSDRNSLVLDCRPGWRTVDTFYPFEPMRVGIQNVVESLCALGCGGMDELIPAWEILNSKAGDADGKIILDGTLSKSYLPKQRVGKPDKWVTFYTLLAKKEAGIWQR